MTATRRTSITNAAIMQELIAVRRELKDMDSNQAAFQTRLFALETDKVKKDAIAEFLIAHPAQPAAQAVESKVNKDLIKYVGMALTIIGSLAAALVARP